MQLLTLTDNSKCPQFFHYLWNICWVQSVASWWKSSNNEALSDFWQRHIQTHKNKFKQYRLCIILSWHVSSVTTICSQKNSCIYFFHSEIIWPKVYLIFPLPQKRNSLVKDWVVCIFEKSRFPFTTQLHRLKQPCLMPNAWSRSPTAAHKRHRRPGPDFPTRPSLHSALATDPPLLQEIL